MNTMNPERQDKYCEDGNSRVVKDFRHLSQQILYSANSPNLRTDFLREITKMLLDFSGADQVELLFKEGNEQLRFMTAVRNASNFRFEIMPDTPHRKSASCIEESLLTIDQLRWMVLNGRSDSTIFSFTSNVSFWTGNFNDLRRRLLHLKADERIEKDIITELYTSIVICPLNMGQQHIGIMQLSSVKNDFFMQGEIELYEDLCHILGFALTHRSTHIQLRERVKELACLYGIAHLASQPGKSLDEILLNIVHLLPPAWLYSDIATARITLDNKIYSSPDFHEGPHKQTSDIILHGLKRGTVELVYLEKKPDLDEGPFLREERHLITTIANEISLIIQREFAEVDKTKLQDQIRHADRLATIGLLAAGVAHEINEPLGNILGFAQLAKKCDNIPEQTQEDIDKIISAALHAREVMKKLMLFARQVPPKKMMVNLNDIVKEGMFFLEGRCTSLGIEIIQNLSDPLPEITADPTQLYQVLVNLVVNAIQAMHEGGKLFIETSADDEKLELIVEDTGLGMTEETIKQIFIPFFTTKDIGEGTGLGLSVVHGIITSHNGEIKVFSTRGKGTRFEIHLPLRRTKKIELNSEYVTQQ